MQTSIRELLTNRKIKVFTTTNFRHGNKVYKLTPPTQTKKKWDPETVVVKNVRIDKATSKVNIYIGGLNFLEVTLDDVINLV